MVVRLPAINHLPISLIVIFIIGLVLRFYALGTQSLWKDEIFSAIEAQKSIIQLLTTTSWNYYGYAPVHYVITHLAMFFDTSDFSLRFPAALLGTFSIVVFYLLARDIFGRRTGLIAAFLLSISVFHLQYSREVRYYSYLAFFSSLTLLAAYNLVARKKKKSWLAIFVVSTLLNLATQLTAVLVLLAELIFFIAMICLTLFKKRHHWRLSFKTKHSPRKILFTVLVVVLIAIPAYYFLHSFLSFFSVNHHRTSHARQGLYFSACYQF